jgi:predicted enzyme related to lactoylglutathione lyase
MAQTPSVTPLVRGIDIAYLYVADLGRAIAFYERAFGLSFTRHGDDWAECTLGDGTRFGFHTQHDGEPPQTPGTVIIDLRVDDLEAARDRLRGMKVTMDGSQDVPTGRFFAFVDADGYRLQVIEKNP